MNWIKNQMNIVQGKYAAIILLYRTSKNCYNPMMQMHSTTQWLILGFHKLFHTNITECEVIHHDDHWHISLRECYNMLY